LLQHQNNPVDWFPWGPEALARAKKEERPIFLSIGYSACHWCHVMEHESFENQGIADYLNEHFVCIKVDREERPDLDQIYMNAVQLMTGRGGWPMSVFLTPELQPFFGGTYWPPTSGRGMPGFDQVLAAIVDAWQNRREAAVAQAAEMTEHLQGESGERKAESGERLSLSLLKSAEQKLQRAFDMTHGGFGTAPKFPHSMDLQVLLRMWQRHPGPESLHMVMLTLDKMASGGIYDHLAGGFARYSVDERWLVPHFEKMLYDNSLLIAAYLEAFTATHEQRFARVVHESADYILKYMTDSEGGFHSTEDADSEGEEGKFYVWTPREIEAVLGKARAEIFCYVYDVTAEGNFEHGTSILNLPKTISQCASIKGIEVKKLDQDLAQMRQELLVVRDQRIRPGKDDKILVSWNALMIDALARASVILSQPGYLAAAGKAATFILTKMSREGGRLLHTYRNGEAKLDAYLDDYAYLVNALVTLYETSFDEKWIDEAVRLADILLARFADNERGGFYFTADDHEQLIARNKDLHDSSVPSGNAMAATALLRLGKLCGRNDYLSAAEGALLAGLRVMERSPTAAGQLLIALDMYLGPMPEIVIVGPDDGVIRDVLTGLHQRFIPRRVVGLGKPGQQHSGHLSLLFAGRATAGEQPSVFICENFTCQAPVSGPEAIRRQWDALAGLAAEDNLRGRTS
ncbi:MAG: thioredoxin domain-containing protein, partial [Pirellulaceae bacterium]|nr:thioredoxin domain-containing protein [Pirellulaceae bacterium]